MQIFASNNQHYVLYSLFSVDHLEPVSLRLMTSQFKDIVTHTQILKTVKCIFFGVWVQNFVLNFKGHLWNFTQNLEPVHRKICILRGVKNLTTCDCPACRTYLIATRFWVVVICPIIKCLTVLEFSFILFDLCLFITIFNFIFNYVLIVTFWIFTYHKIWILLIIFCFIWNYWIIYFLTCLEVFWSVVS